MATATTATRHHGAVRCVACGSRMDLVLELTTRPADTRATRLTVRTRLRDGDVAMATLFAHAHRGPFAVVHAHPPQPPTGTYPHAQGPERRTGL